MKRALVIAATVILLSLFAVVTHAQTVNEQWAARTSDAAREIFKALAIDSSGNVYVTGWRELSSSNWDIITAKYNALGTQVWLRAYDGTAGGIDQGHAIAVDASGNVYVAGQTESAATSSTDMIVIKYTAAGARSWVATYDHGSKPDAANSIALDSAGNVLAAGYSGNPSTDYDFATIKLSGSTGAPLWNFGGGETAARYDGPISCADIALKVAVDSSNNVYVTGYSDGNADGGTVNDDYATVKYNSSGVPQWASRYDGPASSGNDSPNDLALDSSGNVYVTGYSRNASGDYDFLTIKYSGSTGAALWASPARYDGAGNDDYAYGLALDSSGFLYVTGTDGADITTVKYSAADGSEQWVNTQNGSNNVFDSGMDVAVDASGNVYVAGYAANNSTTFDFATIKYTPAGARAWLKTYDGGASGWDKAYALAADSKGNVYVAGESAGSGTNQDGAVVKYEEIFPLPEAGAYGVIRGGDRTHVREVNYSFPGTPGDVTIDYQVWDVDYGNEIQILVNGVSVAYASTTPNEAWSETRSVVLPDADVLDTGTNVLTFRNTYNPPNTYLWGVRDVGIHTECSDCIPLPADAAYGRIRGGDQTHVNEVNYSFEGTPGDVTIAYQVWDMDYSNEVLILVNGYPVANTAVTPNETWSGTRYVTLPDSKVFDNRPNVLTFDNTYNPPKTFLWGVRNVSVYTGCADCIPLPDSGAYGRILGGDQTHVNEVKYSFEGTPGDVTIAYQVWDMDYANEVQIFINGTSVGYAGTTPNETWSETRYVVLPDSLVLDSGTNVLTFDNTYNPPKTYLWGVRNVAIQ